jgi:hypothetical protein
MRRAALAALLAISCTQAPVPSPSPSPSLGAVVTPSPIATAPPTQATTNPFGLVQAMPLGPLSGSWVIALRETQQVDGNVRVEVIATPFGVNSPRVAVSFVQPAGGVNLPAPNGIFGQLSPDGRSIVLGVEGRTRGGELFVVDLEMGRARSLGEGVLPVWGGARIAFQRRHPTDVYGAGTTWLVDPAGGTPTRIPDDAVPLLWHRDSLVVATAAGLEIRVPADARTGFPIPVKLDNPPFGERPVSDFAASVVTVLAIPTFTGTDTAATHRIEVVSTPGAGSRETVASLDASFYDGRFAEPRWNPDPEVRQILYRREGGRDRALRILDLDGGRDLLATTRGLARRAAWSPDGEQIVYTTDPLAADGPATQVRSIRPLSGRDDLVILETEQGQTQSFRDVACFDYGPPRPP